MEQDREIQIVQNEHPQFSIEMQHSHVTKVFLQNLPTAFSKSYMPDKDENVILVDGEGHETVTKFLAKGHRLSGGWKMFAREHALLEKDILVFRRISTAPCKLKVDIHRNAHRRASTVDADVFADVDAFVAADTLIVLSADEAPADWFQ